MEPSLSKSAELDINPALSPIAYWKQTDQSDIPQIENLIKNSPLNLFNSEDVSDVVTRGVLSLSQFDTQGNVRAFVCVSYVPAIPSIHPSACPQWLESLYGVNVEEGRCLLLRMAVWDERYGTQCLRLLLRAVFAALPQLDRLLLPLPSEAPFPEALDELFDVHRPQGCKNPGQLPPLLTCDRTFFIRPLHIRKAHQNDNKEVMAILENHPYRLREVYGDFHFMELITNPESREILVAEYHQSLEELARRRKSSRISAGAGTGADLHPAIGVLVANTDMNLSLLNAHFFLVPFYGLRKPHARDALHLKGWDSKASQKRRSMQLATAATTATETESAQRLHHHQSDKTSSDDGEDDLPVVQKRVPLRRQDEREKEMLERRRRRLFNVEHYMSDLSLIQEERGEPNDPYHVVDDDIVWESEQEQAHWEIQEANAEESEKISDHQNGNADKLISKRTEVVLHGAKRDRLPEFKGATNGFTIEMFALSDQCDERLAVNFVEAAFELYPNVDYAVITIPQTYPTIPLLNSFARVTPRVGKNFHHELYVAHRAALFGHLVVREAESTDLETISSLLSTLKYGQDAVLEELHAALDPENNWLTAYVFCCGSQVVGVAVVSDEEDIDYIREWYGVDYYINMDILFPDEHGGLRVCILSPIFQQHGHFFLEDLHRLSAKTCLYYTLYQGTWRHDDLNATLAGAGAGAGVGVGVAPRTMPARARVSWPGPLDVATAAQSKEAPELSLPTTLIDLVPVKPRPPPHGMINSIETPPASKTKIIESTDNGLCPAPYLLFMSTPRLSALPKLFINLRIVVVGASDTALSFLETLIFRSPEIWYNNLTLVSAHGIPGESNMSSLSDSFVPYRGQYCHERLSRLQLGAWVNIVRGRMTALHRDTKVIEVGEDSVVPYDYLFLFCGRQFSQPQLCRNTREATCAHYPDGRGSSGIVRSLRKAILKPARKGYKASNEEDHSLTDADSNVDFRELKVLPSWEIHDKQILSECAVLLDDIGRSKLNESQPGPGEQSEQMECRDDKELPINVFLLNSELDLENALTILQPAVTRVKNFTLILYGDGAELMSCVGGLLGWGVPPENLLIVHLSTTPASILGDAEVDAAVWAEIDALGIKKLNSVELTRWIISKHDWLHEYKTTAKHISHAVFSPIQPPSQRTVDGEEFAVSCLGMFFFIRRQVDQRNISVFLDSGLVVDSRLTVDRLGRANDPFIFSSGPLITFQRKLKLDQDPVYCNSSEMGSKLAQRMCELWDPVLSLSTHLPWMTSPDSALSSESREEPPSRAEQVASEVRNILGPYFGSQQLIPSFTSPLIVGFNLPGRLYFLHIRPPGTKDAKYKTGYTLKTGNIFIPNSGTNDFCKIHIDNLGFLREILCLSSKPLPVEMLNACYGQHEHDFGNWRTTQNLVRHVVDQLSSPGNSVYHRRPNRAASWQRDLDTLFGYPSYLLVQDVIRELSSNDWNPLGTEWQSTLRSQLSGWQEVIALETLLNNICEKEGHPIKKSVASSALRQLLQFSCFH